MKFEEEFDDELLPSKSQIKRDCDAMQKMGEELIGLKQAELDSMDLPEDLDEAVRTAQKIKSRTGLKRQRQYIGKIMRQLDSDSIKKQLEKIQHRHDTNTAEFRKLERWRDRLLDDDKAALDEIIEAHPDVDRQHINQLARQARREQQTEKPPVSARKLFKYLRELQE
ncbi:MAG: DUF615 domain-containing protein [Gammaproteobacteria bacterium]|nr:DUF615 domain-containing protein [Gammaproteobacteria bacterium]